MIYIIQSLRADLEDREARLRAQEEEMKERDTEINRLLGELRRCQTQLLGPRVYRMT
jgi:chromosome segregation ATPase